MFEINGTESQILATVGAFCVVSEIDLHDRSDDTRETHIRIDAKRQALDALNTLRRGGDAENGSGEPENDAEVATIVEVSDDLTSQFAFAGLAALR